MAKLEDDKFWVITHWFRRVIYILNKYYLHFRYKIIRFMTLKAFYIELIIE